MSQKSRNQSFSYYFCLMIKGSGSIPLTNGSGSGSRRPKNTWIRIRNSGLENEGVFVMDDAEPVLSHTLHVPLQVAALHKGHKL
jgi:hypothetical protein